MKQNIIDNILDQAKNFLAEEEKNIQEKYGIETNGPFVTNESALNLKNEAEWIKTLGSITEKEKIAIEKHLDKMAYGNNKQEKDQQELIAQLDEAKNVLNSLKVVEKTVRKREIARELAYKQELADFVKTKNEIDKRIQNIRNMQGDSKAEKEAAKLQREIENFHPKISAIIPSAPSSPNFEKSKLVKKVQQETSNSRRTVAQKIQNNSSWKKNRISWDTETTGTGITDLPVTIGLAGYDDKGQSKRAQYFLSYGSKKATAEKIAAAANILSKDGKGYYDSAVQLRNLLGLDLNKTITQQDIEAIYKEKIQPNLINPSQLSQIFKSFKLDKLYSYNGAFDVEMIKRWMSTKGVAKDTSGNLQQILESNLHIDLMKEVEKAFVDKNGQSLLIADVNNPSSKITGVTQLQGLRKLITGSSSSSAHDATSDAADTTELAYYLENGLLEGLVDELQRRVYERGIQVRKNNTEFTQEYVNFVRSFFDEMNGVAQGGGAPSANTPNTHLVAKFEKLGYDMRNLANGKLSVEALKEKIVSEYSKVGIGIKFDGNKMGLFPLNKGINPAETSIDDMASVEMATLDSAFSLRRGKQALSNPTYIDQEWLDGVLTPVIYSGYEGQYLHILKQLGATPENSKLVQAILNDDKDKARAIMGIGVKEATTGVPTAVSSAVKDEVNKTIYGKKTPEQMMIAAGLYNTNRLAETILSRKNKDTDKYIVQELYDEFFKQGIIKEAKTFDPYDLKGEEYGAINAAFGLLAANLMGDEFNVAQIRAETGGGDSLLNRLINDERFSQFRDIVKYFASQGLVPKNSAIKEESVIAGYYNSIGSEDILPLNILGDPSNRALAQIFNYNERAGSDITGIESTGRNMLFSSEKGRAWGVDYDKAEFKQYRGAQVTDKELFEALKQISNAAEYTYASVTEGGMVISASMAKELGSYREQNYEAYLEDIQQDFLNRAGLTVSQLNEAQAGTFFDFNNQLITDLTDTTFTSKIKLSSGDVVVGLEKLADGFKLITKKLEHVGTGSKGLGEHGGRHTFRVIDDAVWAKLKENMGLSADTQFLVERDSLEVRKIMPMLRGRLSYLIHEAMEKSNGQLSMEQVFQALQKTTQIGKGMSLVDGKLESSIYYDSNTHSYKYGNGESVFDTDENGKVLEEALKRAYLENTDNSDFQRFFYKMLEMGGIDQAQFSDLYKSTYREGADGFKYYYFDQFINKANEVPYYTKIGSGNVDFFESEGRVKFADRERRAIARSYANSVNAMSSDDLKEGLRLLSEDDKRQTTAGQGRLSKQAISNIEMINKAISNVQTNPSTTGESVLSGGYTNVGDYVSIERGPEGWIIRSKDIVIDSSDLSTEMKYGEDGATGISKDAYEKTIMAKARALAQQNGKGKALDIVLDTGTSRFLLPDIEAVQGHDNSYMPSITDRINNKLFKAGDRGKLEEAIREVFGYKGEYYTAANDKDSSLVKAATEAYVGNSGYSKIVGYNTASMKDGKKRTYNDMEMNEDDVRDMLSIAKTASQKDRSRALRNLAYEANAMDGEFDINQLLEDENAYIDFIVERMKEGQKLISQFHRYPSTSGLDIKYGNVVLNNALDKGTMATSRGLSLMVNADYDGDSIWNRLVLANSDFNTQDDYNKARAAALQISALDNEVARRMEAWEQGEGKEYVDEEEKLLNQLKEEEKLLNQLKDPAAMHYASFTSKHNKEYVGKFSNIATNVRNFAQDIGIDEAMRGGTREAASASLVRAFLESLEQDSISAKKVYARLIKNKGEDAAFEELSVLYGKLAEGKLQEVYEDAKVMGLDFENSRQFELIKNNLVVYQPELYEEITKGAEKGTALLNLLYEGFTLITQSAKNAGMEWKDVVYQTKSRKSILNKVKKKMGNDRAKKASEVLTPPSNTQETKATIKLAEDAVNRFVSGIAKNTDEINHKRSVSVDNVTYADEGVFSVTELINQFDDTVPKSREQELAMKKSAAKGTFAHRLSEILSSIITQDADGNISIDRNSEDYIEAVARLSNELTKLGDPYGVTDDMLAELEARALTLDAAIKKHQGDSDYIIGAGTEREKTLGGKFAGVSDKAVAGQADIITYSDKGVTVADYKFSNQGGDATLAKRKLQSSIYMALEEKEIESALNELTNSGNLDEEQKAKKAELKAKLAAFKKDRKIVIARNYERNGNLYSEIVEMQALETEKALEYLEGLGITKEALLELRKLEEKAKQAEKNGLTLSAEDEERRKALQELFDTAVRPTGRDILGDKSDVKTTTYNAQLEQVDVDDLERKAEKKAQAKAISSYLAQEKNINKVKERLARAQAGLSGKTGDELIAQQEYIRAVQEELALLESRQLQFDAQGKTLGELSLTEQQVNEILRQRLLLDRQHESALLKINTTTKQSEGLLSKMIGGFKQQVVQFLDYSLAYQAVGYIKQGISILINTTKELDVAMVDIQIATGNTRAETRELMRSYVDLGKELGRTTQSIAQASNDWLRAGYQGKEAAELTKASMMLSTLGMIDASSATTYLISTLKGWKISANEVIGVVDKLTVIICGVCLVIGIGHKFKCR